MKTDRRTFLRSAGGVLALGPAAFPQANQPVAIVIDPADPARWAADRLEQKLTAAGIAVTRHRQLADAPASSFAIMAGGASLARTAGVTPPEAAESLTLATARVSNRTVTVACGADARGLAYALLELADRAPSVRIPAPISERPANAVRSAMRLFVSDVEDKPWFDDREMWPQYMDLLASHRFNRLHLAFGIGYDFLRQVTDAYFLFTYPFFLAVPGYNVRATNLPDAERDRNLETLKYISEQAAARGIQFQLGLWMHGYQWSNSPRANHVIEGLTPETHALYCRDALAALLRACPAIGGVTFRIHGESGVTEGSYDFWRTVFEGVVRSGRKMPIDMHTKGIDDKMIETALSTGLPVQVSPKFWAEHMGMPYHQAEIRPDERPVPGRQGSGLMALSAGTRSFTRYGYADLLREDRRYQVVHRIWSGTQRLLLWGDPVFASGYSRAFQFCGSAGVDIMEPLSFKGRRGSGIAGTRTAYADPELRPRWDWQKYEQTYRIWGRALYNPDADPETLRRGLPGAAADALAGASRILPVITTAHLPSAANNNYWPEIYVNQPIVEPGHNQYGDTPSPKVFGNTGPLDPQLFSRINDFAADLLKGDRSGKYSPLEVAGWLDGFAADATKALAALKADTPALRRLAHDVEIEAAIGRFFAAKFRAGVLYAIMERTNDRSAGEAALKAYRDARAIWAAMAERAKGIYQPDITVGEQSWLRGHWLDRLPAMDQDIAAMEKRVATATTPDPKAQAAMQIVLKPVTPRTAAARHQSPARFDPKQPLALEVSVAGPAPQDVRLYYRHVNQAERFQSAEMRLRDGKYRSEIPADYTDSPYPLQYYFEVREGPGKAALFPGFNAALTSQPYFVVRRA